MKNGTRRCSVLGSEIESGVNQLIYMFYDNASLSGASRESCAVLYSSHSDILSSGFRVCKLAMLNTTYRAEIGTNVDICSSAAVLHVASAKRGRR
jgi:hypothetical protein